VTSVLACLLVLALVAPPLAMLSRELWLERRRRRVFLAQPARTCPSCGVRMEIGTRRCWHCELRFDPEVLY
jgi:hypothetical protein